MIDMLNIIPNNNVNLVYVAPDVEFNVDGIITDFSLVKIPIVAWAVTCYGTNGTSNYAVPVLASGDIVCHDDSIMIMDVGTNCWWIGEDCSGCDIKSMEDYFIEKVRNQWLIDHK